MREFPSGSARAAAIFLDAFPPTLGHVLVPLALQCPVNGDAM